jgi:phosphopantetheinyl transferase
MPDVLLHTARPDEVAPEDWRALKAQLDAGEQVRMHRLRRPQDRHAYTLAHVLRRSAAAHTLRTAPERVHFMHDALGAPCIAGHPRLGVSLAHDPAAVACALAPGLRIGVDIEKVDAAQADMALLVPFVALEQTAGLEFYACWTVLEAFWKAMGSGLADANPRIGFRAGPEGRIAICDAASGEAMGSALVLRPFDDCVLAIAIAGMTHDFTISHFHCKGLMGIKQLGYEKPARRALSRA